MNLIRLAETVRHLRWPQIRGQIGRKLIPHRYRPSPSDRIESHCPDLRWPQKLTFQAPHSGKNTADQIRQGTFRFLNQPHRIGSPPDWTASEKGKLWRYNLHYFDWLHLLEYTDAKSLVQDWIARVSPVDYGDGWEPYPTSLRCLNWTQYFAATHRTQWLGDPEFRQQLWESLGMQLSYLSRNLETHLMGNHLLENAAALAYVGSGFEGPLAQAWFQLGHELCQREIPEQILPDGCHFERSPMYHCRVQYLLMLLSQTQDPDLLNLVQAPLERAQLALTQMTHPDGRIALLNDSAFDIYHEPSVLAGASLGSTNATQTGAWSLPDAGYYGYRDAEQNYLICDAGLVGPDYIPGHAHGDLFSYELSLRGHRVIVDTGVFTYESNTDRDYSRATRAHNTVEVDGRNQSDFWGAFRVGRRARPQAITFQPTATGFHLSGSHSGYDRPPTRASHSRTFQVDSPMRIQIQDHITASQTVEARSFIHLAPSCEIITRETGKVQVGYRHGEFTIEALDAGQISETTTDYFPEFGLRQPRSTLQLITRGQNASMGYRILAT